MGLKECVCCFWSDIADCVLPLSQTNVLQIERSFMSLEQAALQSCVTFFCQSYRRVQPFLKWSLSFKVQLLVMEDLKETKFLGNESESCHKLYQWLGNPLDTDKFGVGSLLSEFGVLVTTLAYRNMLRLFNSFLPDAGAASGRVFGEEFQLWNTEMVMDTAGTDYVFLPEKACRPNINVYIILHCCFQLKSI